MAVANLKPAEVEALRALLAFAESCNDALVRCGEHVAGPCRYLDDAAAVIEKLEARGASRKAVVEWAGYAPHE